MKHIALCCDRLDFLDFVNDLTSVLCDAESGEVLEFVFGDDYMFHVVIVDDESEEKEND